MLATPPRIRVMLFVAYRIFCGFAVMVSASLIVEAIRLANLRADPETPWFTVIAVATSLTTLKLCELGYRPLPTVQRPPFRLSLAISLIIAMCLAAVGVMLTNSGALHAGRIALPGDADPAPPLFRAATAYSYFGTAGLIEEAAIRGLVQLGLQATIRPRWAELVAGLQFVLIHGSRLGTPGEVVFVALMALVNGRVTAVTQSTRYAAIAHCLCNLGITSTILLYRKV